MLSFEPRKAPELSGGLGKVLGKEALLLTASGSPLSERV